jgi:cob(I)alamin adenosyltransferase
MSGNWERKETPVKQRTGYVQVYTGNGKGKTTAAFGLALRASGHGLRTYIGQFMKGQVYGELCALQEHPRITIEQFADEHCLLRKADVQAHHIAQARAGLQRCSEVMLSRQFQLVILDEVNVALWFGLLAEARVLELLDTRPGDVDLVLTGRCAPQRLIERADLVTEMRCVKHYYTRGVTARDGIER